MDEIKKQDKFRMLVVDDDPSVLNFFKRLFGKQYSLSVAMDGDEAIRMTKHGKYHLIFLDVKLPGMDGVEVLAEIKKLNPDAVIVMISGYDVEEDVRRALEKGAQDFLPKPFSDISRIMTIKDVAEYLNLHQLTVYRLAQQGKIPFFKTGRQWRIKKDILEKWVDQEEKRSGPSKKETRVPKG